MIRFGLVVLLLLTLPLTAQAEDRGASPVYLELISENDFWSLAGTDRYYTNGMGLTLGTTGDVNDVFRWFFDLAPATFLCRETTGGSCTRHVVYSVAQQMYTPGDIAEFTRIDNDRPYAGWLFWSTTVNADVREGGCLRLNQCVDDTLELQLGIVGPASLADETQVTWHRLYGLQTPNGWANQLRNEAAFLVRAKRAWPVRSGVGGFAAEAAPLVEGAVGTIAIYGRAGARLRAGYNLGDENLRGQWNDRWGEPSAYLLGEATGGVAIHNLFLAGNTFRKDNLQISQRTPMIEYKLGAVAAFKGFRLGYSLVWRSKEFEQQAKGHQYGSLSLGYTTTF